MLQGNIHASKMCQMASVIVVPSYENLSRYAEVNTFASYSS